MVDEAAQARPGVAAMIWDYVHDGSSITADAKYGRNAVDEDDDWVKRTDGILRQAWDEDQWDETTEPKP